MASLDEGSAYRRDLYLATHITRIRQTSMPTAGFEPTIPASERLQTQDLDRAFLNTEFLGYKQLRCIALFLNVVFNPLNPELNPICYLLALLGAHHFLHVSRIRVKSLTIRRLMSYIYGAPILDVSRSHTTTQHSR